MSTLASTSASDTTGTAAVKPCAPSTHAASGHTGSVRIAIACSVAVAIASGCASAGSSTGQFFGSGTGTVEPGDVCIRAAHLAASKDGELCFERAVGRAGECVTVQFHTPGIVRADGRTYLPVDSARIASRCGG